MPSVTDTTVPWLRTSAPRRQAPMRLLISSEISKGFVAVVPVVLRDGRRLRRTGPSHLFQASL